MLIAIRKSDLRTFKVVDFTDKLITLKVKKDADTPVKNNVFSRNDFHLCRYDLDNKLHYGLAKIRLPESVILDGVHVGFKLEGVGNEWMCGYGDVMANGRTIKKAMQNLKTILFIT